MLQSEIKTSTGGDVTLGLSFKLKHDGEDRFADCYYPGTISRIRPTKTSTTMTARGD